MPNRVVTREYPPPLGGFRDSPGRFHGRLRRAGSRSNPTTHTTSRKWATGRLAQLARAQPASFRVCNGPAHPEHRRASAGVVGPLAYAPPSNCESCYHISISPGLFPIVPQQCHSASFPWGTCGLGGQAIAQRPCQPRCPPCAIAQGQEQPPRRPRRWAIAQRPCQPRCPPYAIAQGQAQPSHRLRRAIARRSGAVPPFCSWSWPRNFG